MIRPGFIDHLVFRVSDLDRTECFYNAVLAQHAERAEESLLYRVGSTRLFFTASMDNAVRTHDKETLGLNHIAFGVRTLTELKTIRAQLDSAGISHSGITLDLYGVKEFIWLDDPDGLRVEFYLRPVSE